MAWEELKSETTESLIEYIQWKNDPAYKKMAEDAFRAFTYRFQLGLQKKLVPICLNWGYDKQIATEIAYNTFDRIWKYPKYDKSKSKQTNYDTGVMFYLFGIAKRLLADYRKNKLDNESPFTGDEEIIREFPEIDKMSISIERKSILKERYEYIKRALDRLSPKHKIIYLTYKQFESQIKDGYKLPRKLLTKLRDELDLTQNTVRSYKNEAFNEVKTYLEIYASK